MDCNSRSLLKYQGAGSHRPFHSYLHNIDQVQLVPYLGLGPRLGTLRFRIGSVGADFGSI